MPDQPLELLVAGSIALDTIEGNAGIVTDELGGSSLYFAFAASLITPVRVVAAVGADDEARVRKLVGERPIDLQYLQVLDAPTYRWRAHQVEGHNIDLGSRDSIYDVWEPRVPENFGGWAFVGSVRPDRQVVLMEKLAGAELLAADSMISYIHIREEDARKVVSRAAWYFCNQEEFAALGGNNPDEFRRQWWLQGLVIKHGPQGVNAYTESQTVHVPALTGHQVVDTTGAGDALAAGILARWLTTGAQPDGFSDALVWGVACASLTIQELGLRSIAKATREQLDERVAEVRECMKHGS